MKKLLLLLPILLAAAFLLSTTRGQAQAPEPQPYPSGQYPAEIILASAADLETLYRLNIDIGSLRAADGSFPATGDPFERLIATVYITPVEAQALANAGLTAVPITNESQQDGPHQPADWPTFSQFVTRMQTIISTYPDLVRMVSIGKSVLNRDIWCLKITDNPDSAEDEPEVKYSAAIHGDELTGIEMILRLAELLTASYGNSVYLTSLVDGMETWLCPISNPDGYVSGSRNNAHGVNLNRDFPDRFLDPVDDPAGHEPETQAFMVFGYDHRFVMGANFHGGDQVVNYPWDAVTGRGKALSDSNYAPDDQLFYDFSMGYAVLNPYIWNADWPGPVTRGWEWYQIWGGMQDWAYVWRGEHHVTIELTDDKNPPYNTMDTQWDANREAMIWWMSRALTGMRGLVTDVSTGAPLEAVVQVLDMEAPNSVRTDPLAGDYHRVIGPGTYTLLVTADCYQDATAPVTVTANLSATVQNFQLVRTEFTVEGTVTEWGSGRPLTATVEILGTGLVTSTDPLDGSYAFTLACGGTYTMQVSAPGYQTEERQIILDQNQVQNFSLHPNPRILLVDDDLDQDYQAYYQAALSAIGETYDTWTVSASGSPPASLLVDYERVLWLTGDDLTSTLTTADQANLSSYLDGGGRLFLSGQRIGADIQDTSFYTEYLHAAQNTVGQSGYELTGAGYLAGLSLTIQGGDGADQLHRTDVTPLSGAETVLSYAPPYLAGGVAYCDDLYGMVYFSFGFEGIDSAADRAEVMERTLDWLGNCPVPPSGLSTFSKQASISSAAPGEVVTYTMPLSNTWEPVTGTLTDRLPASLAFAGYLTATQGIPAYADGVISWQGLLPTGETVTITYTAALSQCLEGGIAITNLALLTDDRGIPITRTATITVENLAPSIPQALAPLDGAPNVPVSTLLAWQAADANCDELTYSVAFGTSSTPPILAVGLTTPSFDPGLLQLGTTYYWFVTASDGTVSITSPTWSFTTEVGFTLYLPVATK
jgi:hypothetical protein